ncbi:polyprenyl synthetase family protein [Streptomyces prunicolor]|uniref:polyprenyl synthetase family protein n=1 Tax=Streptomyces prunicolor TaxID=67348 RepID=UPI001FE15095|nr:polyprenyl synthetase family protein [Streptomyces prunicolor]
MAITVGVTGTTDMTDVEAVVRADAALLEDDLAEFLDALTAPARTAAVSVYDTALRRVLYEPVADALGSKVGQQALPPTPGAPGGRAPLRPSMVYWAYRNYRGFSGESETASDLAVIRRTAVAVRILLKAAVALDDIQDGSEVRYGEPALHSTHGTPLALNTGAWLIMSALRHAADPAVVDSLVRSVGSGFTGQAVDMSSRTALTRAELLAAPRAARVGFWEATAALKTGTLFWMPLDAAVAGLRVVEDDRVALDGAMRQLGLASQLFNDLTDFVPEFGGANTHEDFDGLGNRVFLELLDDLPAGSPREDFKPYVLGHPRLERTLLALAEEAVALKRAAKNAVHGVCRSERSAAYFDVTIERKGHLIDRLLAAVRQRSGV